MKVYEVYKGIWEGIPASFRSLLIPLIPLLDPPHPSLSSPSPSPPSAFLCLPSSPSHTFPFLRATRNTQHSKTFANTQHIQEQFSHGARRSKLGGQKMF